MDLLSARAGGKKKLLRKKSPIENSKAKRSLSGGKEGREKGRVSSFARKTGRNFLLISSSKRKLIRQGRKKLLHGQEPWLSERSLHLLKMKALWGSMSKRKGKENPPVKKYSTFSKLKGLIVTLDTRSRSPTSSRRGRGEGGVLSLLIPEKRLQLEGRKSKDAATSAN